MDVYLARQPIFNLNNETFAYELLFRNNAVTNAYIDIGGDASTADVITNSFFDLHTQSILSGKKAFINFTGNLIKRGVPKILPVDTLVVEILENIIIDDEIISCVKELKSLGYTIALDDFVFEPHLFEIFELGDIIKVDFRTPKQSIEETAYICRFSNKEILAEKVETFNEFEYAKSIGCTLMQGYYFSKPIIVTNKSMPPMVKTFMQLLAILNQDEPDTDEVVNLISTDAALVVKLLRLVNSVYYSIPNTISTVKQAIIMLGLETLKEWIYLIGLKRISEDKSSELLKLALMRARFCQEICLNMTDGYPYAKEMYLMGLISTMNAFVGKTILETLNELPISKEIRDGILGCGGIYTDIFQLCYTYERGIWNKVDFYSNKLGISKSQISNCYMACADYIQTFWDSIS